MSLILNQYVGIMLLASVRSYKVFVAGVQEMLDYLLLMPRLYSLVSSLSFQITKVLPWSLIHTIGKSNNNPNFLEYQASEHHMEITFAI